MKRIAQTTRLVPERREEYLALHSAVWPAVEAALHVAQIRNYSIFLHGDTLFAYYEYHGEDWDADLATIKADPETQRWWTFTDPCQEPWPDAPPGSRWTDLPEIWHLGEPPRS
ncbi:L-rhamnose mutarotase [Streptacidiphilus pinicola]|uniref:L-rhamnose mutarotase n=1 Tax=Streptacidiphilus pinicola TaxID=2219663 RepID=A0A2X0J9J2_9ACTN|nr:L-rhamnose mutarotase [Streptacidiphilus pinicola]RAG84148.1 L-rhamnose mutarotase [Streptacidiphilus pinicola]